MVQWSGNNEFWSVKVWEFHFRLRVGTLSYISTKAYVVGTQKTRLNEPVL